MHLYKFTYEIVWLRIAQISSYQIFCYDQTFNVSDNLDVLSKSRINAATKRCRTEAKLTYPKYYKNSN